MSKSMRDFHSLIISNLNLTTEEILDWVVSNYYVDDVYPDDVLSQWAIDNGYVKKEEQ